MRMESTIIKFTAMRLECSRCGAEARASCNCGEAYIPAKQRAAEAIKANPEKSDRSIAADLGTNPMTVGRARKELGVTGVTPERIGRDGKTYPSHIDREQLDALKNNKSGLVILAGQAADLAEMFHAAINENPAAITKQAINEVRRAALRWSTISARLETK